ncbi:MAG: CDP-alcohol phosphatidyltransferase family protein [Betaproteobacteria bacterium AqS2]|uniref:CDP-diacylglycerol--glycerol-3-phosphate 3-phosphatidyltransferase n=1 Tax=Candidatus Amphirhobacter heronislandensis TaxID=1732024 RepID=A0A930UBR9_9GAMM|nr:CDP-alcohol phosphatidyltransferase family protein [Betaproteobacteria bacterium AqS2]
MPDSSFRARLPNMLSWLRIAMTPLVPVCFFLPGPGPLLALAVFLLAALTDYWDGRLARETGASSPFGAFLDPVADKLLVCATLLLLVADPEPEVSRGLLGILAAAIILREIVQSALRDWMAQAGRSAAVAVTGLSKAKTATQLTGLGMLLGHDGAVWLLPFIPAVLFTIIAWIGAVCLAAAAVLGLMSLGQFLRAAFGGLDSKD